MIVVADSSPIIVLVAVGRIDILPAQFDRIVVPPDVAAELSSPKRPESVRGLIAVPPSWLEIVAPSSVEPIEGLHAGELAAIALARELRADQIVLDEYYGRKAAAARGLRVVGTVGVLEAAARRGLVDLGEAFEKIKRTDFWVSPAFLDRRLALFLQWKEAGELDA